MVESTQLETTMKMPNVSEADRMALPMPTPEQEKYIPESLVKMELKDEDIFLRNSKNEFQRIVFTNQAMTDQELLHWKGFMDYCAKNNVQVPPRYLDYESMLIRYL